jgi:hypothetical protein
VGWKGKNEERLRARASFTPHLIGVTTHEDDTSGGCTTEEEETIQVWLACKEFGMEEGAASDIPRGIGDAARDDERLGQA